VIAHDVDCSQPRGVYYRIGVGSRAVQKLRTKLDRNRNRGIAIGENPAPNAAARFHYDYRTPLGAQFLRGGQPGRASTYYYCVDDVVLVHSD
jgi:hypothetical protein